MAEFALGKRETMVRFPSMCSKFMRKIIRIWLNYEDGDRIIVEPKDLEKYDLSKPTSIDIQYQMSVEEFEKFKHESYSI